MRWEKTSIDRLFRNVPKIDGILVLTPDDLKTHPLLVKLEDRKRKGKVHEAIIDGSMEELLHAFFVDGQDISMSTFHRDYDGNFELCGCTWHKEFACLFPELAIINSSMNMVKPITPDICKQANDIIDKCFPKKHIKVGNDESCKKKKVKIVENSLKLDDIQFEENLLTLDNIQFDPLVFGQVIDDQLNMPALGTQVHLNTGFYGMSISFLTISSP